MEMYLFIALGILLIINIISFFIVIIDKENSRKGKDRINEGILFFWAAFFGGIGIYLSMFTVRHKTRKWYFYFGIPLMIVQNICFLFLLYKYFEQSYIF